MFATCLVLAGSLFVNSQLINFLAVLFFFFFRIFFFLIFFFHINTVRNTINNDVKITRTLLVAA